MAELRGGWAKLSNSINIGPRMQLGMLLRRDSLPCSQPVVRQPDEAHLSAPSPPFVGTLRVTLGTRTEDLRLALTHAEYKSTLLRTILCDAAKNASYVFGELHV